jgi:hypothetical protein
MMLWVVGVVVAICHSAQRPDDEIPAISFPAISFPAISFAQAHSNKQ